MRVMEQQALIGIAIVALVAFSGLVLIYTGGLTGAATKTFYVDCFTMCRRVHCNEIPSTDESRVYPCINTCLNSCIE